MKNNCFILDISEDDDEVAYLYLPNHPGKGKSNIVSKQVILANMFENYKGPDVYLDFDETGCLIGIELLA